MILINAVILFNVVTASFIYYGLNYSNQFKGEINAATPVTPSPTQPGAIAYNNSSSACAYKQPGSLILAGRDNYGEDCFKQVSAAGGHVLIYIDAVLYSTTGRYHKMLYDASECGAAASQWPGSPRFNSYGIASDFRVGSVVQQKLECVLEKMVIENPHMAGFFADDLGSANGPLQNSAFNKEEWYQGAVGLSKTFRKVANKYNLIFMVNGVWQGGSQNGGYPDRSQTGNALVDGACVEHHPIIEGSFSWPNYLKASQWADQSPVTNGTPVHFAIANPGSQFDGWKAKSASGSEWNGAAWLTPQLGDSGYSSAPSPWGSFHSIGLPKKVTYPGTSGGTTTPSTGGGTTTPPASGGSGGGTGSNTGQSSGGNTVVSPSKPLINVDNLVDSAGNIKITAKIPKNSDGDLIADFNHDGFNDIASDENGDGYINVYSEIVGDGVDNKSLTSVSATPILPKAKKNLILNFGPFGKKAISESLLKTLFKIQIWLMAIAGVIFFVNLKTHFISNLFSRNKYQI